MAYLASGEFDSLIEGGALSDSMFDGKAPAPQEGEIRQRGFITSIKASPDISDAVKKAFTANGTIYETLPNSTTIVEANAIISAMGEAEAKALVLNPTAQMPAAFRVGVAQILIKRYNASGDIASAVDVAEGISALATDWGQGIQALSLFSLLTPEGQLMAAQRDVAKQRDKKINKRSIQKKITKVKEGLEKEQKDAAKEVANKYGGKSPDTTIPAKPQRPKTYGSRNKAVSNEEYERARQELLNKMKGDSDLIQPSVSRDNLPIPDEVFTIAMYHYEANNGNKEAFTKALLEDLGQGMDTYASDLFDIASQEVGEKIKNDKAKDLSDKLEKLMQPKTPSAPTPGKTKAERMTELAAEIDALEGGTFYQNMVAQELADQAAAADQKKAERAAEVAARQAQRQADVASRKAARDLATAQRKAARQAQAQARQAQRELDAKVKRASSPRGITETLKGMGTDMNKLIRSHFESQNATREALVNKLVQETGLSGQEAVDLAAKITDEFNKIATERKKKFLDRNLPKNKKTESKDEVERLIEKTNAGVLDRSDFEERFADIMGFPARELSDEERNRITELTKAIEEAKSIREKDRATIELLKYREKLKGYSLAEAAQAVWMANTLSGPRTQIVNIIANSFNTLSELAVGTYRKPKSAPFLVRGLTIGLWRGMFEAADVIRTGQAPLRGKIEVPGVLENMDVENMNPGQLLKYMASRLKYVRRFMMAADTVFYEGLKQMRSFQLAYSMAFQENKDLEEGVPPINVRQRAIEILKRDRDTLDAAIEQARDEKAQRERDIEDLVDAGKITSAEAKKMLRNARIDERFRIHEILEKERDKEITSKAHDYAARGTFNYTPEGVLGAAAQSINSLKRKAPVVGYFVPFVNVIANVANELINYTPLGAYRANRTSGSVFGEKTARNLDEDMRSDMTAKAVMGTTITGLFFLLSNLRDDEDEPYMEITANGTGNYNMNDVLKKEKGWQEYSLRVKNPLTGEYTDWISYRYSPLLLMLSYIGDINDQKEYRSKDIDPDGRMLMAVKASGAVVRSFFEATFFPSVADAFQIIGDDKNENFAENLKEWGLNTSSRFVIPNFYTQTVKYIDQFSSTPQKETMGDSWSKILVQLPVAKNKFNEKINAFGEPIYQDMDLIFSEQKENESTKYWDLIMDKRASISPPKYSQQLIDPQTNEEREMTNQEFYKFSKIRGQYIKAMLASNYDLVSTMNQEQFGKWFNGVKGDASNLAKTYTTIPLDDSKNYWEQIETQFYDEKLKKFVPIRMDVSIENLGTKTTERAEKILTPEEETEE